MAPRPLFLVAGLRALLNLFKQRPVCYSFQTNILAFDRRHRNTKDCFVADASQAAVINYFIKYSQTVPASEGPRGGVQWGLAERLLLCAH